MSGSPEIIVWIKIKPLFHYFLKALQYSRCSFTSPNIFYFFIYEFIGNAQDLSFYAILHLRLGQQPLPSYFQRDALICQLTSEGQSSKLCTSWLWMSARAFCNKGLPGHSFLAYVFNVLFSILQISSGITTESFSRKPLLIDFWQMTQNPLK